MQPSNETEDDRILWCGNLHEDVTEEILFELFLQAGPISKVKLITSKDGKPPYAFITFEHCVSVAFAKELMSNTKLFGKPIKLQLRNKHQSASMESKMKEHKSFNEGLQHAYLQSIQAEKIREVQNLVIQNRNIRAPIDQTVFRYPACNSWAPNITFNPNQQQWHPFPMNFNPNFPLSFNFPGNFK